MKKLFLLMLSLVAMSASAQTYITYKNVLYQVSSDDTYLIAVGLANAKYSGEINITSEITWNGSNLPVKAIASKAFYNANITSLQIITDKYPMEIGDSAFARTIYLSAAVLRGSYPINLGKAVFYNASSMTGINLQEAKITSIPDGTFGRTSRLGTITIPKTVTKIGESAFSGSSVKTVNFEASSALTEIGNSAFYDCRALTSVTIPDGVTTIGNSAFFQCALTSITVPYSVTSIGENVFCGCTDLESATIRNSKIGNAQFYACTKLSSVAMSNRVTSIGDYAFSTCRALTSITIPSSVTSIGEKAFYTCSALTNIKVDSNNKIYDSRENCNAIIETATNKLICGCKNTIIPAGVTTIGRDAFYACPISSIDIPQGVTMIMNSAFSSTDLESVTIPASVTFIGTAFSHCTKLSSVKVCWSTPLQINYDDTFEKTPLQNGSYATRTLYVPNNTKTKYQEADGWKNFDRIEEYKMTVTELAYEVISETEKTCRIVKPEAGSYEGKIVIPETINGYKVVSIGPQAFYKCTDLTRVILPATLETIEIAAFEKCTGLTSIYIPASVTSIGNFAFWDCTNLKMIVVACPTPPEIANIAFLVGSNSLDNDRVIVVPSSSYSLYKSDEVWGGFNYILGCGSNNSDLKEDVNNDGQVNSLDVLKVYKYMQTH